MEYGDPKISMDTVRLAEVLINESAKASRIGLLNVIGFAAAFEAAERSLRAINTRQCNGYMNERTWKEDEAAKLRDERREAKLRAKVEGFADQLGIKVQFNGDPRGAAVKIHTPKCGKYNTFGGAEDGWAV
jgi:hypothetical protein